MKKGKTGTRNAAFWLLIVSGALTAGICLVMNLWLIPAIEGHAGGLRVFDMRSFGYTPAEGRAFLTALDAEGTALYLTRQLPLDFLYPAAYTAFFVLLLRRLFAGRTLLCLSPLLLTSADLTENVCSILLLRQGNGSDLLLGVASTATLIKSVLMAAVFLLLLVGIVRSFLRRTHKKITGNA